MIRMTRLSKLLAPFAFAVALAGCGNVEPAPSAPTPTSPEERSALMSLASDPEIVREVRDTGTAWREIGADGSFSSGAFSNVTGQCVCCKMWGDTVYCTRIPCTSDCTN